MTLSVIWSKAARQDLREVTDYIAQRNPEAAKHLSALIRRAAERLADHPFLYRPGRVNGTREAVIHPNYIIVYQVTDRVRVLTILHARQQYP